MRIRVVVVDDFPLMQSGIATVLERDPGIEVVGRGDDGEEALKLSGELQPDVLVLDLNLPGLSGLAVIPRIRTEQPQVRVLVLTATERAESLLDAVAAGASGYLSKRASPEELRQAVITVYGGGSVITPSLAGHLLREYSHASPRSENSLQALLTGREQEVLRLIAQGHSDKEIASALKLSPRTVQNHLAHIRDKTGVRRRSALARCATQHAAV